MTVSITYYSDYQIINYTQYINCVLCTQSYYELVVQNVENEYKYIPCSTDSNRKQRLATLISKQNNNNECRIINDKAYPVILFMFCYEFYHAGITMYTVL